NNMGSKLSDKRTGFPNILQHDTVLAPADCGGPLVDLDGKAVGINIARAGRVESFAIPSDTVLALLPDLKSGKLAPKGIEDAKIGRTETAVKEAEHDLTETETKGATAKELVKKAEEAKKLFENDGEAVEAHRRAVRLAESVEKRVAQARAVVDKARAELK